MPGSEPIRLLTNYGLFAMFSMRGYIAFACCRYLYSYAILLSLLPNTARMASVLMTYNFGREVTLQKSLRTSGAEVNVESIE